MTKSDVVDAFIRGDLDRRGFIKRLTAIGVSSAAAMAYAGSLVQSTSAAPVGNGSGFITRFQGAANADATYGPAIPIDNIREAIQALLDSIQELVSVLQRLLADFAPVDFAEAGLDETNREIVSDIVDQIREQAQAMASYRELSLTEGADAVLDTVSGLIESLGVAGTGLDDAAGKYAALIPALEDLEERELFTQIGIATGRYAGVVNHMAGMNPVPGAFEEPIDPAE